MNKAESKYFNTACLMDEALLDLLEKKDFELITIKEICKRAGVNRSTFYLHYDNTGDLLAETMELISRQFLTSFSTQATKNVQQIATAKKEDLILISPAYLTPYLEFVRKNLRAFKVIHKYPQLFAVETTLQKMYRDIFAPTLRKFDVPSADEKYIFEFYTRGVLGIIMQWVSLNCQDDIAHIQKLILDCVKV